MIELSVMIELQVLLGASGLLNSNASKSHAVIYVLKTTMQLFSKQFSPQSLLIHIITFHLILFANCS
jgi:hypothetical protein